MPNVEFTGKRKTKPTGFSLAPYLVEKLEEYNSTGKYGNKSAIASQALYEFFAREDMRNENGLVEANVHDEIVKYLNGDEGKALIKSIIRESLSSNSEPIVTEEWIG